MNRALWLSAALLLAPACAAKRPVPTATASASEAKAPVEKPLPARPLPSPPPLHTVLQPVPNKPVVSFRLVFRTGSVDDPKGKEGLTALTVDLMGQGGTQSLSSAELLQALFPMAAELSAETDKELTTFSGRVHRDHLDAFFKIFTDVLLEPRWDPKEFERLKADSLNAIRNDLRSQDDESLGKVALDALVYRGHPYAHFVGGTVQGLSAITLEDVKAHAKQVFTQDRLVIGLAGAVDEALASKVRERLAAGLPSSGLARTSLPAAPGHLQRAWVLKKDNISTAVSMGYAYPLRRGDPDFFPVALALSYLGEHRQFHGVLFNELRERRGLNYGDYAYPEHFLQEGGSTYARTNILRTQQEASIWIRPVEPANGLFATRGALYYLRRLVREGIPPDQFEVARGFLTGYTRLWEQTDQRRLGFAIDSALYGTPDFLERFRAELARLTPAEVHDAVKRNLDPEKLNFVFVAKDADALASALKSQAPSPISYPTPKAAEVLEADKAIGVEKIPVRADRIEILDAASFMER